MRRVFLLSGSEGGAGEHSVETVPSVPDLPVRGFKKTEPMKRLGLLSIGLLVMGLQTAPGLFAADTKAGEKEKMTDKTAAVTPRAIPLQGNVVAVDPAAHTFTLNGKLKERVFKVSDQTEIMVDNKQAQFGSITVGSMVRGNALKHEDGWETKRVSIGPKEPAAPQAPAASGPDMKK
jgi:hypothetical protein